MHIPIGWRLSKLTTQPYANLTYLLVDETGLDEPRVDEMVVDEPQPKPLDYGIFVE